MNSDESGIQMVTVFTFQKPDLSDNGTIYLVWLLDGLMAKVVKKPKFEMKDTVKMA